jgi:hypothetical protein
VKPDRRALTFIGDQDLGLGVLVERRPGDEGSSSDESTYGDDDDDGEMSAVDERSRLAAGQSVPKETDVLGHLMGRGKKKRRSKSSTVIEEMGT